MAKHRINENGHMIWFDTDEEYYAHLDKQAQSEYEERKRERQIGRRIRFAMALIIFIILLIIGETFEIAFVLSLLFWIVCVAVHYLKKLLF